MDEVCGLAPFDGSIRFRLYNIGIRRIRATSNADRGHGDTSNNGRKPFAQSSAPLSRS